MQKSRAVIRDAISAKSGSLPASNRSQTPANKSVTLPTGSTLDSPKRTTTRYSSGDLLNKTTRNKDSDKSLSKVKASEDKDARYPSIVSQNFTSKGKTQEHKNVTSAKLSPTLNTMSCKVGDIGKIFDETKEKKVVSKISQSKVSSSSGVKTPRSEGKDVVNDVTKAVRAGAKSPRGEIKITSVSDRLKVSVIFTNFFMFILIFIVLLKHSYTLIFIFFARNGNQLEGQKMVLVRRHDAR